MLDKLRAMATFVAIVDGGSLTAAARRAVTSLPTVVRTLAGLEAALGVRLLNRTTRRLSLTDEGRDYYERCKRVLAEIDEAERTLVERKVVPTGKLVVTASVPFGRWHVAPLVLAFLAEHRQVSVELLLLDRIVNLTEEGIDVAVRMGPLADSSLVAVPVGQTRKVTCASPAYLRRRGVPSHPDQLPRHACVRLLDAGGWTDWAYTVADKPRRVAITGAFATNQLEAAIDACAAGLGCGQFLGYQVQDRLGRGELRAVLTRFEPQPIPIHVVYPQTRLLSARVRALVDWLVAGLRARPSDGRGAERRPAPGPGKPWSQPLSERAARRP
jgi:DNA-binding transcriptional LysR family regulator